MSNMKFIDCVICILVSTTFTWGLSTNEIMKSVRECKTENNCQENLLLKLGGKEIPQTNECLNAMYCTGQKTGLISADNKVNGEVLKTILTTIRMTPTMIAFVVVACQSQLNGSDHAESMRTFMSCIKNNSI